MGLPAARVGDPHICPMFDGPKPHVGGPVLPAGAMPTVWIGGMMAATMGTLCTCVSAPDAIMMGSPTVYIGGRMAARMFDPTIHGGRIILGCPTVWIGDLAGLSGLLGAFEGLLDKLLNGLKAILQPLAAFVEGAVKGFGEALMATMSGIAQVATEILTDPLAVLERAANFIKKLDPAYWAIELATNPRMRTALAEWLSNQTRRATWDQYSDIAKKLYSDWQNLSTEEKWTAAGQVTGKGLEFAAELALLRGATKAVGTAAELAKTESTLSKISLNVSETANGIKVSNLEGHALERAIGRGVSQSAIEDALKKPLKIGPVVMDNLGRPSQRFVGQFGEVVVNPETGKIVSVNPTSSKKAAKLLKK